MRRLGSALRQPTIGCAGSTSPTAPTGRPSPSSGRPRKSSITGAIPTCCGETIRTPARPYWRLPPRTRRTPISRTISNCWIGASATARRWCSNPARGSWVAAAPENCPGCGGLSLVVWPWPPRLGIHHAGLNCGRSMFDAFRKFLSDCTNGDKHPSRFADDDYRLAASALLVHAAAIDGEITPVGRDKLHAVIKRRFELDEETTNELV